MTAPDEPSTFATERDPKLRFIIPGIVTILIGLVFARAVVHEDRSGHKQAAAQARVAKEDMWRVIVALLIVVLGFFPKPLLSIINPAVDHTMTQVDKHDSAPTVAEQTPEGAHE